jgi:hypothetical protein
MAVVVGFAIFTLFLLRCKPPRAFPTSLNVILVLVVVLKIYKGRVVVVHPIYWVIGGVVEFS